MKPMFFARISPLSNKLYFQIKDTYDVDDYSGLIDFFQNVLRDIRCLLDYNFEVDDKFWLSSVLKDLHNVSVDLDVLKNNVLKSNKS